MPCNAIAIIYVFLYYNLTLNVDDIQRKVRTMSITYIASYIIFHGVTIGQEMAESVYFTKQQMQWLLTQLCHSTYAHHGVSHARGHQEIQKFAQV